MSVRKLDDGTWESYARFRDAITGKPKSKHKRGFATRREALAWERNFVNASQNSPDMTLDALWEKYLDYITPRIKRTTLATKRNIVEVHILPYLGKRKLVDIDANVIASWQRELTTKINPKTGEPYKNTFVRTVENQLSALLNFAVKFCNLSKNPMQITGRIGKKVAGDVDFWAREEFKKFADVMLDKPESHAIFMLLFWTGLREGEALALTPQDIVLDPVNGIKYVSVTKNYQWVDGKYVIQSPKTQRSVRQVTIPDFLAEELDEYISTYNIAKTDRLFPMTKHKLYREMERRSKAAGVKRIRVHDLQHSYISLLFSLGRNVVEIANLVGQKETEVTFRYAHMMSNANDSIARILNDLGEQK